MEQDIDILLLAETKFYTNTAINIKGFQSFPVVRDRNTGGGLCICIWNGLFQSAMTDSGNKVEFITVRLNGNTSNDHIRIIFGRIEITLRSTIRGGGEDWIQFHISVSRKRDLRTMVNHLQQANQKFD